MKNKYAAFVDATQPAEKAERKARTPKGTAKRDDPDYKQALAYVRRDTHKRVMGALIEDEREYSELVEELLTEWLKRRKKSPDS